MKKIAYIFSIFIISFFFISCDEIEEPYFEETILQTCPSPESFPLTSNEQKVLILDFTGHKCGNCPDAHIILQNLMNIHHDKIIPIAIHCAFYSEYDSTANEYYYDFTTPTGFEFGGNGIDMGYFDIKSQPTGLVNSLNESDKAGRAEWSDLVDIELNKTPNIALSIINTFDETERKLCTHVKTEFLEDLEGKYFLAVYLIESHIINWQTDYSQTPADIPDYEHNHVLRAAINGSWGREIASDTIIAGSSIVKSYAYNLPNEFIRENCAVVAFVYDDDTKIIMQTEEAEIVGQK